MSSLLFTLTSFIVALGLLVSIHEYGHFWVARKLGVRVLRFSVGFGKPLLRFRGRPESESEQGTEYVIAAIPLGGYVKMLDEREEEVPEGQLHRAFNRQSLPVRSAIVAAGPLSNFLFAIFAFWLINVTGDIGARPLIGAVTAGSVAEQAGFRPGDEFVSVGGKRTPTWESSVFALLEEATNGETLLVKVADDAGYEQRHQLSSSQLLQLAEGGRLLERLGLTPKRPEVEPVVSEVVSGEAADRAGIRAGDRLLSLDGVALETWSDLVQRIQKIPGKRVSLELERQGRIETVEMTVGGKQVDEQTIGRIGAAVDIPEGLYDDYRIEIRYGPLDAVGVAVERTWDMSLFMLKILGRMVVGEMSVKNLSGPISIAESAGKSASYGFTSFLKFLALVSVSLGVLNLLPIPVLDGGHLLFFLIEALKGSPLSEEAQAQGQRIGLMIMLALMGLAFYVDLSRLLG
ncbi:MAG: RIP metalloprotease RseP [Candidatus Sedimenticola sp. (ex Thyasira tokunagai)]